MPENLSVRTGDQLLKVSMNMFGMPYQFPDAVDPRVSNVSRVIGNNFARKIVLEAPIATIIPGNPTYLPTGDKDQRMRTATAILSGADNFEALAQFMSDGDLDNMRLYDFEPAYPEYMGYVNSLCNAGAAFLGLDDAVTVGSSTYNFQNFNWMNYRWNTEAAKSLGEKFATAVDSIRSGWVGDKSFHMGEQGGGWASLAELATNYQYVQFYVDTEQVGGDSLSNSTSESQMKSIFDQGSSSMRDLAFMANSGGLNAADFQKFADDSLSSLQAGVGQILGGGNNVVNKAGGVLQRLINLGGDVIKGHNIIIPDIYQNSQYSKGSSTITVHLKSPYGSKLAYYLNIFVPMMHLMALAMPRMQSSNSYSSPFLLKLYVEGLTSINLGICQDISIQKVADSLSVDGLPMEVDVTLNIIDLYSDLCMVPESSPIQFVNNSSLIEFLATNCGMSLTKPNYKAKFDLVVNAVVSKFTNIPATINAEIEQRIHSFLDTIGSVYH